MCINPCHICIYTYIYIERKRGTRRGRDEGWKKRLPQKQQARVIGTKDSDGVSESENKRQENTLKVMCFMDSKKKSRLAHLLDRLPFAHAMPPATGALVEGEGPRDGFSRAAHDFLGMSCVLERVVTYPENFVCLSTRNAHYSCFSGQRKGVF